MKKEKELTIENRTLSICRMIRQQFPAGGEGKFMYSIIEKAIKDASNTFTKRKVETKEEGYRMKYDLNLQVEACRFLLDEIPYAEICGVRSDWIRDIIKRGGFCLTKREWIFEQTA